MKDTIKNIFIVTIGNISTIIAGVLVSFVIPRILSIEDYGFYKTFTLYCTYLSLCHLGLIDGIVLKYGSFDFDELPKKEFSYFFKWYLLINGVFSFVLLIVSLLIKNEDSSFIMLFLAIYLLSINIIMYFQQISQITQRFKEFSKRKIIQSVFNILIVVFLYYLYMNNINVRYRTYVILLVLFNTALTIWYIYTYRKISLCKSFKMFSACSSIFNLIRIGFPVLISNMCSTLILTLDRQFVNILFNKTDYAIYAFAYNMLSLVTVATSAISSVIYPILKRTAKNNLPRLYYPINSLILIFVYAMMSMFFPLCNIIEWLLPKYLDSLNIFRWIFPGLAFSSLITVVMQNYYKVYEKNDHFFTISVIILIFTTIMNYLAYCLFGTKEAISITSIITMFIWYILVDTGIRKIINDKSYTNTVYIILMSILFYYASSFRNYIGLMIYLACFAIITYNMYKSSTYEIMTLIIKKGTKK